MRAKTIFIIVVTVLVTVILMKNTDEVSFWIFGNRYVPKLAVLGIMFGTGLILGYLAGRPRKKKEELTDDFYINEETTPHIEEDDDNTNWISPEDDEYIR